ncbi:hypothetical protein CPB86DRAFT_873015 [Serendipita vermifera]|nr:hypothetical protein CPB86DRAFT_873015 [Serendipita vermifera]
MLLATLNVSLVSFHIHVTRLIPLYLILCLSTNARSLQTREVVTTTSAWNGHSDVTGLDDYSREHFSPYYIPTGSVSLDDTDSNVVYTPNDTWATSRHPALIDRTMHVTSTANAKVKLIFEGIGVEWFGSMSPKHGIAEVFINDTLVSKVDTYHATWLKRQRLYGVDHLPFGMHSLAIVNTGQKRTNSGGIFLDIDAFVINPVRPDSSSNGNAERRRSLLGIVRGNQPTRQASQQGSLSKPNPGSSHWSFQQGGETGVHAMQLSIISSTHAIIIDKVEHNPLSVNGHPAWGALYDLRTNQVRPLDIQSNSFCAGGSFLSNGSLINVGGNPVVMDRTGAADFGDTNGVQSIRLFNPNQCDDRGRVCDVLEMPHRLRLATPRWYNTVLRLDDGSAMILGGSTRGGWINNATTNNPTIEYFPPKNLHGFNGLPIPSPFLADTLNSNLFPIAILLPDSRVFVAANQDAMVYDWKANTEQRLPRIPNGVRVTYPMTGTATLLPLSPDNHYIPVILICGGSTIDDTRGGDDIDSQEGASDQCVSIEISDAGIQRDWIVEVMPNPRVMPDSLLLPTGEVLIINGGATGIAGYGNVKNQIGNSNADHPVLTPVLYRPSAPIGSRFTSDGMPTSDIARLYHSVATLVPDGRIMIAGSNPNLDRSSAKYSTEYRVEWMQPAWMGGENGRPLLSLNKTTLAYGSSIETTIDLKGANVNQIKVALMDLGFVTHSLHMNSRLVYLDVDVIQTSGPTTIRIRGPPKPSIYPPGPGWVFLVVGEKWSVASPVLVGEGLNPPEDPNALQNMLANSGSVDETVYKNDTGVMEGGESI